MGERAIRKTIIEHCLAMNASGLNRGTAGNISVRRGAAMLITPSGVPYEALEPGDIALMPLDRDGEWDGPLPPSSEWRFHLDILRARPEIGAIVHTHSPFATVLAVARREIPACHYMIAAFGGAPIRCAGYATFGTKELSDAALAALDGRLGCLLANHGQIALGESLEKAMWRAVELESLAEQYYRSLLIGGPVLLDDAEIVRVEARFATYGLRQPAGRPRRKT